MQKWWILWGPKALSITNVENVKIVDEHSRTRSTWKGTSRQGLATKSLNVHSAERNFFQKLICRSTSKRPLVFCALNVDLCQQVMELSTNIDKDIKREESTNVLNVRNYFTLQVSWQFTWESTQRKNHLPAMSVIRDFLPQTIWGLMKHGTLDKSM